MGFMPDGSVHKRNRNIVFTPKNLGESNAVLSAQSSLLTGFFTSSVSYPIPAGALPGDFAVFVVLARSTDGLGTPTGWTFNSSFNVLTNGVARIYTRTIQAGDTSVDFGISNVGVSYLCAFQSYTGASEIALNSQIIDAAASSTASFANVPGPLRRMNAILIVMREGVTVAPWFSFTAQGNLAPINLYGNQVTVSPPAYSGAIATGRMGANDSQIGVVTGSLGATVVCSTASLLIR